MKNLLTFLTAFMLFASVEVNGQDITTPGILFEENSWSQILQNAKNENKLIFLDAYASWCGPCKHMDRNVFTNNEVGEYYNNKFICARFDMEKGEGVELAKQYKVNRYPTFLFINSEGKVVHQACGTRGIPEFVELGSIALSTDKNTSYAMEQFSNGNVEQEFISEYIKILDDACISVKEPLATYFYEMEIDQIINEMNAALIFEYVTDFENKGFKTLVEHQNEFVGLTTYDGAEITGERIIDKIYKVYTYELKSAAREKDRNRHDQIKRLISTTDIKLRDKILWEGDMYWYQYQKDWSSYVKLSEKFVQNYALKDYRKLNSIAWTYYENVKDQAALNKALEWALISTSIKKEYSNMDTLAALYYKLGIKDGAMNAAQEAISIAEKNNIDSEDTQQLLDKIMELN